MLRIANGENRLAVSLEEASHIKIFSHNYAKDCHQHYGARDI
jgi:hypothetical protein